MSTVVEEPVEMIKTDDIQEVTCSHCGTTEDWNKSAFCPQCGFYPTLGRVVDCPEVAEEELVENWWELIPTWAWVLGGGVVGLLVVNVLVRLLVPHQIGRTIFSFGELWIGLMVFGVSHFQAYYSSISKSDTLTPLDLLVKPGKVWQPTMRELPETRRRVWLGGWSLAAMIFAPAIVGGLNPMIVLDWMAARESANASLTKAVSEHIAEEEGDGDLEGAMNDFADEATKGLHKSAPKKKKQDANEKLAAEEEQMAAEAANQENRDSGEPEISRDLFVDCVVVGFTVDAEKEVNSLQLAGLVQGSLKYIGSVSTEAMNPLDMADFKRRIRKLYTEEPTVPAPVKAYWLKPSMTCRINFESWTKSKLLKHPEFDSFLQAIDAD